MRISNARDIGLYVRGRRREIGMSQTSLADKAGVSRRWLSDLEAGKATAEIGLVFRTLDALRLVMDVRPDLPGPDDIDLDKVLRRHTGRP